MTYRDFFEMLDFTMRSMDDNKHGLVYYQTFIPEIAYLVDMGDVRGLDTEVEDTLFSYIISIFAVKARGYQDTLAKLRGLS